MFDRQDIIGEIVTIKEIKEKHTTVGGLIGAIFGCHIGGIIIMLGILYLLRNKTSPTEVYTRHEEEENLDNSGGKRLLNKTDD